METERTSLSENSSAVLALKREIDATAAALAQREALIAAKEEVEAELSVSGDDDDDDDDDEEGADLDHVGRRRSSSSRRRSRPAEVDADVVWGEDEGVVVQLGSDAASVDAWGPDEEHEEHDMAAADD